MADQAPDKIEVNNEAQSIGSVFPEEEAFKRIGEAVRQNMEHIEKNTSLARKQSNQFFKLTLGCVALGFIIILVGVSLLLLAKVVTGVVSASAGIIPEVIAALFFKQDKELRKTIEKHDQYVFNFQKLLIAIDVAETVQNDKERDLVKQQIIHKLLAIDNVVS